MKPLSRYPFSVSLLHWLLAIALIGNLVIGCLLDDREDLVALHKSIGICILVFALVRLTNRLRVRDQVPPSVNAAGTPAHFAEAATHRLLYVLMLAVPLLGWLKTNTAGHTAVASDSSPCRRSRTKAASYHTYWGNCTRSQPTGWLR